MYYFTYGIRAKRNTWSQNSFINSMKNMRNCPIKQLETLPQ